MSSLQRVVNMSNGNPRSDSIWPLITILVGIVAVGAVTWDVMLHRQNQALEGRLQKVEGHLSGMEAKEKAAETAAAVARRKARTAAAAEEPGGQSEKPAGNPKTPGK